MTCCQIIKPHNFCLRQKRSELQVTVAINAWVRCASPQIFRRKFGDYFLLQLIGIIKHKMRNLQLITDMPGIINRVSPAATGAVTLLLDSKAHGNSRYGVARLFEE